MKVETNRKSDGFTAKAAASLLTFALGVVPGVFAGPSSKISVPEPGAVISHLEIAGGPAARMRLAKKDGKWLLYIGAGSGQEARVVDVTTPEQPATLETSGAIPRVPRLSAAKLVEQSPELLALLNSIAGADTQRPHKFSGSARFLADVPHKLIFVVDGDGLWIVKARESVADSLAPVYTADDTANYGG